MVQASQVLDEVSEPKGLRLAAGDPGFRRDRGCLGFLQERGFLQYHGRIVTAVELPGEYAVLDFDLSLKPLPLNLNEVLQRGILAPLVTDQRSQDVLGVDT